MIKYVDSKRLRISFLKRNILFECNYRKKYIIKIVIREKDTLNLNKVGKY